MWRNLERPILTLSRNWGIAIKFHSGTRKPRWTREASWTSQVESLNSRLGEKTIGGNLNKTVVPLSWQDAFKWWYQEQKSLLWILLKHVLHICPIKTVFQLELHRWKISWTLVFYNFKRLWHSASKEAFVIFGYIFAILPPSQPDWCCTQIFWKKFMVQIDLFPPSRYPLGWSCEFTQRNGLILVYHRSILCCDLKFNPSCQFMW